MKKIVVALSLAAVVGLMAAPTPAAAAVNVAVAPPGGTLVGFATPRIVLSQAAPAQFLQLDPTAPHDITEWPANAPSNYRPKFKSATGQPAGVYPIEFNGTVAPGDYRFICKVHPNMIGTATVV